MLVSQVSSFLDKIFKDLKEKSAKKVTSTNLRSQSRKLKSKRFYRNNLVSNVTADFLYFQGQIVDAFMTPIFGILVDQYLKKKIWHIVGSVMVTLSFPVIFGGFSKPSNTSIMLVYVLSIAVFQTGWAAVQISHLSMIPTLTNSLLARADLTAIR